MKRWDRMTREEQRAASQAIARSERAAQGLPEHIDAEDARRVGQAMALWARISEEQGLPEDLGPQVLARVRDLFSSSPEDRPGRESAQESL